MLSISWCNISRADDEKIAEFSQNKLAQELWLDPMMVSNILKLLEKKWYITREKSWPGLQNVGLSLTVDGQARIDQAVDAVDSFETEFFDTKDPKKLKKQLKQIVKSDE